MPSVYSSRLRCLVPFAVSALLAALVFALPDPAGAQTYVPGYFYSFGGYPGDGIAPVGKLAIDADGNVYGTTAWSGASGAGTVFELVNNSGTYSEKILYSFTGVNGDGGNPEAGVTLDANGNVYGTTEAGGASGVGTVFELVNNSGTYSEKILHSFTGANGDGLQPYSGVTVDANGNLYGTTRSGGSSNFGTVFELVNSSGTYSEKILHSFTNVAGDGEYPFAGVILDANGNLYGTTAGGGSSNVGTVFELVNSSGTYSEKILYSFTGLNGDGELPEAGVTMDANGNLFGTTFDGGSGTRGTVFELVNSSGTYSEKILHSFTDANGDGASPEAGVIVDANGNLFGTTLIGGSGSGGSDYFGTVYELVNNSGTYTEQVLHTFTGYGDGASPSGDLAMDSSGNLYGTAGLGGLYGGSQSVPTNGDGLVFVFAKIPSNTAAPTSTTLTASPNPALPGATLTFTATVALAIPYAPPVKAPGQVSFYDGSMLLGTAPVAGQTATLSVSWDTIGLGTYTVTAQYTPSVSYLAASTGSTSVTVTAPGLVDLNGNNTFNGNQTVNGTVSASLFSGNGSGLTNVTAAALNCTGCVGNTQLGVNYALGDAQGGNALNALNARALNGMSSSAFAVTGSGGNTFAGPQIVNGSITVGGALSGTSASFSGPLASADVAVTPAGTATASQAFSSGALDTAASLFNSNTGAAQNLLFRWQAEPAGNTNNTASPAATLNLLYGANGAPLETGISVAANGALAATSFAGDGSGLRNVNAAAFSGTIGESQVSNLSADLANAVSTSETYAANEANTAQSNAITTSEGFATNAANASQTAAQNFASTAANNAQATAETFATNAATTAQNNAEAFATASANTAGGAAVSTAETYANNTFVPLAGGTMTGALTAPAVNSTGAVQGVSVTASGALAGGSLAIGGGTPITQYLSLKQSITLPAVKAGACTTMETTALTGFTPGDADTIALGIPGSLIAGLNGGKGPAVVLTYQAWETSTSPATTITLQVCNVGANYGGGGSGAIRIDIFKH